MKQLMALKSVATSSAPESAVKNNEQERREWDNERAKFVADLEIMRSKVERYEMENVRLKEELSQTQTEQLQQLQEKYDAMREKYQQVALESTKARVQVMKGTHLEGGATLSNRKQSGVESALTNDCKHEAKTSTISEILDTDDLIYVADKRAAKRTDRQLPKFGH